MSTYPDPDYNNPDILHKIILNLQRDLEDFHPNYPNCTECATLRAQIGISSSKNSPATLRNLRSQLLARIQEVKNEWTIQEKGKHYYCRCTSCSWTGDSHHTVVSEFHGYACPECGNRTVPCDISQVASPLPHPNPKHY